jgi:hypothetical protein
MLSLSASAGVTVERMIGVYCGMRAYRFGEVQVWPAAAFCLVRLPNVRDTGA